ncbi:calcium-binding protein [Kamptonema animale CS-326]|jgi:serralysin|uniref:calcium-binding protein n=1 Tax=Kamptonema animale TaxID=92934 RepID=UPI00232B1969|nr:calcium-binding protein [Kamptonema animale]MDB9509927.1 calcium-binding protein [Kamptonema animale CS-326]
MSAEPSLYEALAKIIAYQDDKPEFEEQVKSFLETNNYYIDQIFDDLQSGLHAIGLASTDPDTSPVLIFRGTDFIEDDAAFSDERGVGYLQIDNNREILQSWLTQITEDSFKNPTGLLPDVIGHGMGGALAQILAAEFTSKTGNIFTFNSPGVSADTVNTFRRNLRGANKTVNHYIVNGDIVSLFGESVLTGRVFVQNFNDPNIRPLIILNKNRTDNLLTSPPDGFSQRQVSTEQLILPSFTYTNDSDFTEFQTALSFIQPDLSEALKTRESVERLRTSGNFSFSGLLQQIQVALAPSQANYLVGDAQNNSASAGGGDDTLIGGNGNDTLRGNQGDDTISGGNGSDFLYGGKGIDTISGGEGADFISGDAGDDILIGGGGQDRFVLAPFAGIDTIVDFEDSEDIIVLSGGFTFAQLKIIPGNNGPLITVARTGEVLAIVEGIAVSTLSTRDFITI